MGYSLNALALMQTVPKPRHLDKRAFLTQTSAVASFISISLPIAATLAPSACMASARSMTLDE